MSQPYPGQQPYYPPPKKRKVWLWVLLGCVGAVFLLFVGCAVIIGGAASSSSSPKATGAPCAGTYLDKQDSDICADGNGTVTIDGLAVNASKLVSSNSGIGGTSLCSDVTIKNGSSESKDYNVLNFKLQSPTGDVGTGSAMGINETLNSGTLVSGGTKTGKVCGDTHGPAQHGQWVLIYKPNAFLDQRGIWLAGI